MTARAYPGDEDDPAPDMVLDLVGVGFGPANLALAIAVAEREGGAAPVRARFAERQPVFGWHRGMLLEDATMQVSFLKDLVTLRNPTSPFSFLAYLHDQGRLVDFVNHKSLFPLRIEFHDYLEWAAARVSHLVDWGTDVREVRPVRRGGIVEEFEVLLGGRTVRTRNLVVGTGLRPKLPVGIHGSARVWHNSELLARIDEVTAPRRVVVVGAGQSAAEVVAFLHDRFPDAEVCSVFSRYGYSPADDSPFANRIFDPAAVDDFYAAPADVKRMLLAYHGNTNYSVVDGELIEDLYRRAYREKVTGRERLRLLNVSRVLDVTDSGPAVRVVVDSLATGGKTVLDADLVVFATGYDQVDPLPVLGEAAELCRLDADGRVQVERDYRLRTQPELRCGIFLQGGTEHTHGISSSLLSNAAIRAGEILDAVTADADLAAARAS
jgi:L-ornithine N5-monooxygenase